MGKKSSPAPPPAPDPAALAAQQAGLNKDAALTQASLNRLNETTPFGSVTYGGTGSPGDPYSRTTRLDPAEQALLDSQRGQELRLSQLGSTILDRVQPSLATPFSLDGLPPAPTAPAPGDFDRTRVEQALFDRLNPQLDRDRAALENQLVNQGFARGSEGFSRALGDQDRARNDARLAVIAAGGQEQSRGIANAGTLFGLGQAARQSALQERAFGRSQPLNEIAAILGTGQVSAPSFGAIPQVGVGAADITNPTMSLYGNAMSQYNADRQRADSRRNAIMGGLFGLGGAALTGGLSKGGFLTKGGGLF